MAVNVQHVTRAGWRQCSVLCIVGLPKCTVEATMRDAEIVNVALYVGDILNLRVNFDRGTVACQDPQTMIERLGEALWGDRQAFRMNRI